MDKDKQEILANLSDIAEDFCIELLNSFTEEDMEFLSHTCDKLIVMHSILEKNKLDTPYTVTEVIRLYLKRIKRTGTTQ